MFVYVHAIACTFNVCLEFVVTFPIAWNMMNGLGFRKYHGQSSEDAENYRTVGEDGADGEGSACR